MSGWDEFERLDDDELVDGLIGASLPERAERREVLFEVLRERFKDIPIRAFRQARGNPALEEDFVHWFWRFERLLASLMAYRRVEGRRKFANHLFVKARWLARDYFRDWKRRRAARPLRGDVPAKDAGNPGEDIEAREAALSGVRHCVERLRTTLRLPFKLVHLAALDLADEDWAQLLGRTARPRAELEASLAAHRRADRRLTLAEVGALMNMKLHTVGTYVARAEREIAECVRRSAGRESGR